MNSVDLSLVGEKLREAFAFCIFSKPGEFQSELYIQSKSEETIPEKGFCFSPFTDTDDCSTIYISSSYSSLLEDAELDGFSNIELPLVYSPLEQESYDQYVSTFSIFHEELSSDSELEKLVLSRVMEKEWEGNPFLLFKTMKNKYPENFVYLLCHPEAGVWLAASPETLLEVSDQEVQTMALAGTKMPDNNSEIFWGQKEIDEHQFVVEYIESTLKNAGCLNINVGERQTVKAGKVFHLMTPIVGDMNGGMNWFNLSQDLHPTPAVCGTPKIEARNFILENETHNRKYYCGFVGPYSISSVSLFVNLRCMSLYKNKVSLFLGGGITKASVLEDEWKETENKALTLLDCLKEI